MGGKDVDKRVIRTKSAIRRAFNELVLRKDISSVTVSELVAEAGITRSTFYMYYGSVLEVRDDVEREIISHIDRAMDDNDWLKSMVDPYPLLAAVTKEVVKYDEFNRFLLAGSGSGHLVEMVTDRVVAAFTQFVSANHVDIDVAEAKYIAAFFAAGVGECFKLWYRTKTTLSLEELCRKMSAFVARGLSSLRDGES